MADPQLVGQMQQIVKISFSTGTANAFGEVSVATTVSTFFCRIQTQRREYEKMDGTEVRSDNLLLFDVADGFTPSFEMRIWFPGESTSTAALARRPVRIHGCVDEFGNVDHWEVNV